MIIDFVNVWESGLACSRKSCAWAEVVRFGFCAGPRKVIMFEILGGMLSKDCFDSVLEVFFRQHQILIYHVHIMTGDVVYTEYSCILFTICGRISDTAISHDGAMLRNAAARTKLSRAAAVP